MTAAESPAITAPAARDLLYVGAGWLAYVGWVPDIDVHRHPASAYCVGLQGPFRASDPELGWELEPRVLYVPADVRSPGMRVGGQPMGFVFLGADHPAYYRLRQRPELAQDRVGSEPTALADGLIDYLGWLQCEQPPCDAASRRLEDMLEVDGAAPLPVDPRIQRAIRILVRRPEAVTSAGQLAAHLAISETRLVHLFSEQTGLPFRRFRLWTRLMLAGRRLSALPSLTHLALGAGFSDLAHLSRSFRSMFGIRTSAVLRLNGDLEVRLAGGAPTASRLRP